MNGHGKITLAEGAKIIQLPTCGFCKKLISVCECGVPVKRPA